MCVELRGVATWWPGGAVAGGAVAESEKNPERKRSEESKNIRIISLIQV